jgi:hypothetical protein
METAIRYLSMGVYRDSMIPALGRRVTIILIKWRCVLWRWNCISNIYIKFKLQRIKIKLNLGFPSLLITICCLQFRLKSNSSWSCSCGRQSVDQLIWVSGLPLGPLTRFYLALLFSADNYLIFLSKASSLTRKRVCILQWNHSLVPITVLYRLIWDCVPFLSPLTMRRDYGGSILTRLHTGL